MRNLFVFSRSCPQDLERTGNCAYIPLMRVLIAIMLLVLVSGAAWILNFESNLVAVTPCKGGIDGKFIAKKDCDPEVSNEAPK